MYIVCRLMADALMIHVNTWLTTHLPTLEGRKAEFHPTGCKVCQWWAKLTDTSHLTMSRHLPISCWRSVRCHPEQCQSADCRCMPWKVLRRVSDGDLHVDLRLLISNRNHHRHLDNHRNLHHQTQNYNTTRSPHTQTNDMHWSQFNSTFSIIDRLIGV